MSAYFVFTREKTLDPAEMAIYQEKIKPTVGTFDMKPLAVYGKQEVLEGPAIEGVVIIEFPTTADALAWYRSPAYEDAMVHRYRGAEYRAVLVEGI